MTLKLSPKINSIILLLMLPSFAYANDISNNIRDKELLTSSVLDDLFPVPDSSNKLISQPSKSNFDKISTNFKQLSPEQKQKLMQKVEEIYYSDYQNKSQQNSATLPKQHKNKQEYNQHVANSIKHLSPRHQDEISSNMQKMAYNHKKAYNRKVSARDDHDYEVEQLKKDLKNARNKNRSSSSSGLSDTAFRQLLNNTMPLSPEQIITLRKLYDISQQAAATTPKAPPTPISSSTVINLEPGNLAPVIRLAAGFVTSLVITDSTGSPWPIAAYSIGDPGTFNIQWDKKTNTMFLQAQKNYSHGNLALQLHDLNTPVMISLVSGQREVDFRVDMQVAGRGPEAKPPVVPDAGLQSAQINQTLINLLDGIPPKNSSKLQVSGYNGEAWVFEDKLYFRTKLTVLSPAWISTISSPDGTNVYEMTLTPLVLASKDGKIINVQLMGL